MIKSLKDCEIEYPRHKYSMFRLGVRSQVESEDKFGLTETNTVIDWYFEPFEGYTALMDAVSVINFFNKDKDLDLVIEY